MQCFLSKQLGRDVRIASFLSLPSKSKTGVSERGGAFRLKYAYDL